MSSIQNVFSDNEGNHLLVALDFCDDIYKLNALNIPEEFADTQIIDINIGKVYVNQKIHFSVFFKMSTWLMEQFQKYPDAIFTYICAIQELPNNHPQLNPQQFRWQLFDALSNRILRNADIQTQDVIIGSGEYQTFGRAFYRLSQAPIIHLVTANIKDKYDA